MAASFKIKHNGVWVDLMVDITAHELAYNHTLIATAVQSAEISIIKKLTAAEYAALVPKVSTTMYVIVG